MLENDMPVLKTSLGVIIAKKIKEFIEFDTYRKIKHEITHMNKYNNVKQT